jgi:UV DNA damage endonuclease
MTIGVQNAGLSRCVLKNATPENIRKIAEVNLSALETMIDYNINNGINLFRISSDIIPFGSHSVNNIKWQDEFSETFLRIGKKIRSSDIRVSMHPGQYTVLNSPDSRVLENAINELKYHGAFLDALGMDSRCKIILHIGGVYGDKGKASKTFIRNYFNLPQSLKNRLIIENDDKNYNIQDVLKISKETGAPVVFDNLHNQINSAEETHMEFEWIELCEKTWEADDGKQKIHYSQQKEGALLGSHSTNIDIDLFSEFYQNLHNKDIDIMLEVKDKNLSAVKCINTVLLSLPAKSLEEEWAKYKYFVLSRSARIYNDIRELLKDKNEHVAKEFYKKIEQAYLAPQDNEAEINAAEHVWGYVNKNCSKAEKNRYEKLLFEFENNTTNIKSLKNHLLKCAQKQEIEYLKNSLYFYI